jgi:hypothetical protein
VPGLPHYDLFLQHRGGPVVLLPLRARREFDMNWYDRQGAVLSDFSDIEQKLTDPSYKILRQEKVGHGRKWISTVWIGIDHNFSKVGVPLIFETMVFNRTPHGICFGSPMDQLRYATEEQALHGHDIMRRTWRHNRFQRRRFKRRKAEKRRQI